MAVPQEKLLLSVNEYLEFEKTADARHEYVDGVIYAMAGESKRHNRIGGRLYRLLADHLENSNCEVYIEAVKVYVRPTKYYYPDVTVICSANDDEDDYTLENPVLIIEVLSPSTGRIDRAEKMLACQKIPTLQEYLLIEQKSVWLQIYRRRDDDNWAIENYLDLNDEIEIRSVDLTLKVKDVYRNIKLDS